MSTDCQSSNATAIPSSRMVAIHDAEHMPQDYSTTPGGTAFSTTPGGTYIYSSTLSLVFPTSVDIDVADIGSESVPTTVASYANASC